MANKIHAILFKDKLPVNPRHNSTIERPRLATWASRQLSGPRIRSRRARQVAMARAVPTRLAATGAR